MKIAGVPVQVVITGPCNEVLPRLWIGDAQAVAPALQQGWSVLNVLETAGDPQEHHIPILVPLPGSDSPQQPHAFAYRLEEAARWIDAEWRIKHMNTLVHCGAGIERSPLTLAWYMMTRLGVTLDEAYVWLVAHRPIVGDRRTWLPS